MRWLEIIELRTVTNKRDVLESQLQKLRDEINKESEKNTIEAYFSALIDSDFSIHLNHHSKDVEYRGSQLGLRLASALKEFGLINHSIWVEMNSK